MQGADYADDIKANKTTKAGKAKSEINRREIYSHYWKEWQRNKVL